MKVNRVSKTSKSNRVAKSPESNPKGAGRKSKVAWLRTTKAGRDTMARFVQFLGNGASLTACLKMLGVSRATHDRWIQQGIDGVSEDAEWYLETLQVVLAESIAKAEIRVYQAKPLEWLKASPTSRDESDGWHSSHRNTKPSEQANEEEGKGGSELSVNSGRGGYVCPNITNEDRLQALIELRDAGLDLNNLIDRQRRNHGISQGIAQQLSGGLGQSSLASSYNYGENVIEIEGVRVEHNDSEMMRGAALSCGTPGVDGPNANGMRTNLTPPNEMECRNERHSFVSSPTSKPPLSSTELKSDSSSESVPHSPTHSGHSGKRDSDSRSVPPRGKSRNGVSPDDSQEKGTPILGGSMDAPHLFKESFHGIEQKHLTEESAADSLKSRLRMILAMGRVTPER